MYSIERTQRLQWLLVLASLLLVWPAAARLKPGDALPDLQGLQLEGAVPEIKGKVVLLDFWASWCGPCQASFPAMEQLRKKYETQGLVIIAVSLDEQRADMEKFLKRHKVGFAVVRDAQQKLVGVADPATMPTSLLIDRSGKIRAVHNGFRPGETPRQYEQEIPPLLSEKPGPPTR